MTIEVWDRAWAEFATPGAAFGLATNYIWGPVPQTMAATITINQKK